MTVCMYLLGIFFFASAGCWVEKWPVVNGGDTVERILLKHVGAWVSLKICTCM